MTIHSRAVKRAARTSRQFEKIFNRLGNARHPRGRVISAYRQATRSLSGNTGNIAIVRESLDNLRFTVQAAIQAALDAGVDIGTEQARYEISSRELPQAFGVESTDPAMVAIMAELDRQLEAFLALVQLGESEGVLLGDDQRVGVLSPSSITAEAERYIVALFAAQWAAMISESTGQTSQPPGGWKKQAVAGIDENTTDCCLRVHAQVVGLNDKFTLTGTPRYADEQDWTPFHKYCRTSIVLLTEDEANDALSQEMRDAAQAELDYRADANARIDVLRRQLADYGEATDSRSRLTDTPFIARLRVQIRRWTNYRNREIHPADARSRR